MSLKPNETLRTVGEFARLTQFWFEPNVATTFAVVATGAVYTFSHHEIGIPPIPSAFYAFVAGMGVIVVWYFLRAAYWKLGRIRKIGVAYEGFEVRLSDWLTLVRSLYGLFKDSGVTRKIALRKLPLHRVRTNPLAIKFREKYSFDCILLCKHSEAVATATKSEWTFRTTIAKKRDDKDLIPVVLGNLAAFFNWPKETDPTLTQLESHAENVFEFVLFLVGRFALTDKDFETAQLCLAELDHRFMGRGFPDNSVPRVDLRFWLAQIMARNSAYPPGDAPKAEAMSRVIEECDLAIKTYGAQFPFLHNTQARNLFYACELEKARDLTRKLLEKAPKLPAEALHMARLHAAVLSLFLDDFQAAAEEFCEFNRVSSVAEFGMQLVDFADFARDYGHDAAVFLQVRYREALAVPVNEQLRVDFATWQRENNIPTALCNVLFTSRSA